jgi:hypothetical protein
MCKVTRLPRPVKIRKARLLRQTEGEHILELLVGNQSFHYWLAEVASDFGRAFRLTKWSSEGSGEYDILLDGIQSQCECKGWLRWGHCKHVESLSALVNHGRI